MVDGVGVCGCVASITVLSFYFLDTYGGPARAGVPIPIVFSASINGSVSSILTVRVLFGCRGTKAVSLLNVAVDGSGPCSVRCVSKCYHLGREKSVPLKCTCGKTAPRSKNCLHRALSAVVRNGGVLCPREDVGSGLPRKCGLLQGLLTSRPSGSIMFVTMKPRAGLSHLLHSRTSRCDPLSNGSLITRGIGLLSMVKKLCKGRFSFPR